MTTAIDRIAAETSIAAAPTARKRRIPRRIGEVIELLLTGACTTQKAAAERIGMSPQYVSTALRKDYIRVFIARRVREHLAAGTLRAAAKMLELVDSDSQRVAFEASRHVLAIDGVRPVEGPSVSVSLEVKAGWVLDLRSPAEIQRGVTIDSAMPASGGTPVES